MESGVVVHAFESSTWETEAETGGSLVTSGLNSTVVKFCLQERGGGGSIK